MGASMEKYGLFCSNLHNWAFPASSQSTDSKTALSDILNFLEQ